MRTGTRKMLFMLLLIPAAISGCGGGGGSSSAGEGASTVTKAQFIKEADAICKAADEAQLKAASRTLKSTPGQGKSKIEKVVVAALLPPVEKETEELSALQAPSADAEEIAAFVEEIEKARDEVAANPSSAFKGALEASNERAVKFGFKACSEPL